MSARLLPAFLDGDVLPWWQDTDQCIERVLWNGPATDSMRHADAGYLIKAASTRVLHPWFGGRPTRSPAGR